MNSKLKWKIACGFQENAHFSIAEALIAAIEQMIWNQTITPKSVNEHDVCDSDEEIQQLKQRIRIRRSECLKEVRNILMSLLFSEGACQAQWHALQTISSGEDEHQKCHVVTAF
jgi:hypothetical protein